MILGAEDIVLRRFIQTRGSDGRTTKTLDEELIIEASVQPVSGEQREALPEGVRKSVELVLHTHAKIRTADQQTGQPADLIVIDGEEFIAVAVKEWRRLMSHFEVAIQRYVEADDA